MYLYFKGKYLQNLRILTLSSFSSSPVDAGSVGSVGQEEFGAGLDSGTFLAHLEADEAAVQEANKFLLVSTECVVCTVYSSNITVLSLYMCMYISRDIITVYRCIITVYIWIVSLYIYRCIIAVYL